MRAVVWTALLSLASCRAAPVHPDEQRMVVIEVHASFDFVDCPLIGGISAAPLDVAVGSEIQLHADVREGVPDVAWSSSSARSRFGDARALETTYRCMEVGPHELTLTVIGARGCKDRAHVEMTCGPSASCGDGVRSEHEHCDDGNLTAGDGCSELCAFEVD